MGNSLSSIGQSLFSGGPGSGNPAIGGGSLGGAGTSSGGIMGALGGLGGSGSSGGLGGTAGGVGGGALGGILGGPPGAMIGSSVGKTLGGMLTPQAASPIQMPQSNRQGQIAPQGSSLPPAPSMIQSNGGSLGSQDPELQALMRRLQSNSMGGGIFA